MLGGTLRQGAAQWFIVKKTEIETVDQFFLELGSEFIPADLQERLRDQLGELSQGQSRGLDDYVSRFRHVITQVQEMSELDKIMYFVRGLAPAIRTERWTMTVRIVALRMEVGPTQNLVRWKWTMSESWVVKSVCVSAFASIAIDLDIERQSVVRRASRDNPMVEHNLATVDEVDYPIVFDNAELNAVGIARKSNLFVVNGRVDDNNVRILIDSGASTNLIQRGLVKKVLNTAVIEAQGFDGRRTKKQVNEVEASCQVQDKKFEAMQFTEWDLPNSHDVIFGQPWFAKHNPLIYRRKQTFALPEDTSVHERSGSEICSKIKNAEYEELLVVKVSAVNDISPVVPPELKPVIDRFADCFPELLPDGLLPERAVNFELQPKPDAAPSSRPPFRLSKTEQDALEEFVRDNVKKGWIEVSNSPWISNIFGVPKKDSATGMAVKRAEWLRSGNTKVPIRWVIDYRYVSSQTKIPKIPLPHIEELFDQMLGATVFTVIDLAQGYHQMRVKPDSRHYTAFRSQKETYQWCVAPMGLAGMPGVWSRLMRVLFGKFKFAVVYLDDICIFSRSMKDHAQHLAMVCEVLRHEKLYARLSKCEFGKSSVHFLGHTVTTEGIQVDAKKTTAIEKYPTPTTQKTLLSFLGLAGYYRRFICDFARIALPLHRLIKRGAKWTWSSEHDHAFHALKLALQQAPTLRLPDFDRRFTVTTDASGYCMGGVLSQKIDGFDAPIAFYSKKFGQYEEKWPAHEKELLAIKFALSKWRNYLHGRQFDVFTDNSACRWMLHHPKVTPKLARMLTFFSQFDFVLHHVKGSTNVVADALSRPGPEEVKQSDELPVVSTPEVHACDDACHARSQSISRHVVSAAFLRHLPDSDCSVFLSAVDFRGERRAVAVRQEQVHTVDTQWASVHLSKATQKAFQAGYSRDPSFAELVTNVIQEFHDAPVAAHPGVRRTQLKAAQWYYWPALEKDIHEYVGSCQTCARWKSNNRKKIGLMMPIPTLQECWDVVSMDFITGLPVSEGFDAIFVTVDKLSKRPKYHPTHSTADAESTAKVFFEAVVRHHGLPKVIISDRDPKFTSDFWKSLTKLMGIKLSMTTPHRAQADGQTNIHLDVMAGCGPLHHPLLKLTSTLRTFADLSEQFTFQLAMKRPSDQVNREERPSSKRQQTAPELFDISPILKKKGELEFYKERFFSWRRINDRDDPNQHIAAQIDSWRTFVRLENENKMERLLRRGNARAERRTPADDRANRSSGRRSVAPGDATSSSHSCGPRREHQTPMSDEVPTCPSPVDIHATELCRSVDGSTASFLDDESVDLHDRQSTQPPSDALPESLTTGVGLNEKTIERLWKWKSAHRGQIEALQQRCSTLEERCESLENLVVDHESKIDDLTEGSAQCSALESRYEERFQQVQDELVRLQKNEKSRELAHDRLLRSVEEAGSALEVLRGEYHSRLQALEAVKDQSFDVLQLLYAEKNLQSDELFALRNQVERLHDQLDRLRKIS
ncbi:Retroelement pol polyprotein, partial [Globisporangium splendens]